MGDEQADRHRADPVAAAPRAAGVPARLRADLACALADLEVGPERTVALLDFPDHGNVGDSAIWQGELAWLDARRGRGPDLVCDVGADPADLDARLNAAPGATILLHGGGNFGDLWPAHQRFRLDLLRRHRGRRIVQLPQSIHFDRGDAIAETAEAIAAHGAFTLFVRDRESLALARDRFACDVRSAPDMAFALGETPRPRRPRLAGLQLLRTDHETRGAPADTPLPPGWMRADWLEDEPGLRWRAKTEAAAGAALRGAAALSREALRARLYGALSRRRVARGLDLIASARVVVTDRLHVHILATLMDVPHVALDNRTGKISRYAAAHDTLGPGTCGRSATTLEQAMSMAAVLGAGAGDAAAAGRREKAA